MAGEEEEYRNPTPTVDIIIELGREIVLIQRDREPLGWALPGGFVDEGETIEQAAIREALEETCLEVKLQELLYVYSDPRRDPRKHTMSCAFIARAQGTPRAADDARAVQLFDIHRLPQELCFDHGLILQHYLRYRRSGERPRPGELLSLLNSQEF